MYQNTISHQLVHELRNRNISRSLFRAYVHTISPLLAQEIATQTAPAASCTLIPILRSGIALLPAFIEKFPDAGIAMLGYQREKCTRNIISYYENLHTIDHAKTIIILEPIIATGTTLLAALQTITAHNPHAQIICASILVATPGIKALQKAYPDVSFIYAQEDPAVDDAGFIDPGIGDFGDRYFGT